MTPQHGTWIALIRAIGPLTHKKMSMAQLRAGCVAAGFTDVRTILATGNVVFASDLPESENHQMLTSVIAAHDLHNDVFLRRPKDLRQVVSEDPFPEASIERPNHMLVLFMATSPSPAHIAAVEGFDGPERINVRGREAYIDYRDGVGKSKLTPVRLERLLGQPGTARNWNTIKKLINETSGSSGNA